MAKNTANINGQAYSFVDVKFQWHGIEAFSLQDLSAKESQDKVNNYGNGEFPQSRGRGKKETEFSCSMSLKDAERFKALSPTGMMTDIPLGTGIITMENGAGDVHEFMLTGLEFSNDGLEIADGDTEARLSYEGIFSQLISRKIS